MGIKANKDSLRCRSSDDEAEASAKAMSAKLAVTQARIELERAQEETAQCLAFDVQEVQPRTLSGLGHAIKEEEQVLISDLAWHRSEISAVQVKRDAAESDFIRLSIASAEAEESKAADLFRSEFYDVDTIEQEAQHRQAALMAEVCEAAADADIEFASCASEKVLAAAATMRSAQLRAETVSRRSSEAREAVCDAHELAEEQTLASLKAENMELNSSEQTASKSGESQGSWWPWGAVKSGAAEEPVGNGGGRVVQDIHSESNAIKQVAQLEEMNTLHESLIQSNLQAATLEVEFCRLREELQAKSECLEERRAEFSGLGTKTCRAAVRRKALEEFRAYHDGVLAMLAMMPPLDHSAESPGGAIDELCRKLSDIEGIFGYNLVNNKRLSASASNAVE